MWYIIGDNNIMDLDKPTFTSEEQEAVTQRQVIDSTQLKLKHPYSIWLSETRVSLPGGRNSA